MKNLEENGLSEPTGQSAHAAALRIAVMYLVCAGAWILLSDLALDSLVVDEALRAQLEIYKGLAFVLVTAVLVFATTHSHFARIERARALERESLERLRGLAFQMSSLEERERRRISELIHDRIGQILSLQKIELSMLRREVKGPALERTERLLEQADTAINEARILSWELSPALLYQFGLTSALEQIIADFRTRTGVRARADLDPVEEGGDQDIAILVYRIANELLANVAKHSGAQHVDITLRQSDGRLKLTLSDDGSGFDPEAFHRTADQLKHFGLPSIRERVRAAGGSVTIESAPGSGTRVVLIVPFEQPTTSRRQRT